MLDRNTVALVKSTAPLLNDMGTQLTAHFYRRLFTRAPELQHIFNRSNQASGRQQQALFNAIAAYLDHLDDLSVLSSAVERIAHKHSSVLVTPAQYEIVGEELIATLEDLAGERFTEPLRNAWVAAYRYLADIFIQREAAIYTAQQKAEGGWQGWRRFVIRQILDETPSVKSFIMEPEDRRPIADYQPGQYVGIQVRARGSEYDAIRQYSLSDAPNGVSYRVSVKHDIGGEISPHLHQLSEGDVVNVTPPAGDFFIDQTSDKPVVLLSGGIGQTPLLGMLNSLIRSSSPRQICYLHACENGLHHAFAEHLKACELSYPNISVWVWYRSALPADRKAEDYDFDGLMQISQLKEYLPLSQAEFYCCGPEAFMSSVYSQLLDLGVDSGRIHYENFGPHRDVAS